MFKSTIFVLILRVVGVILSFYVQILISRTFGVSNFGVFTYTFSIIFLISSFSTAGLDMSLLIRGSTRGKEYLDRKYHRYSNITVYFNVIICIVLYIIFLNKVYTASEYLLIIMACISSCLNQLRAARLRAQDFHIKALMPDFIYRNVFIIISCALISTSFTDNISVLMTTSFIVGMGVLSIKDYYNGYVRLTYKSKSESKSNICKYYKCYKYYVYYSFPFVIVTLMQLVISHADIQMIAYFKNSFDVGLYSASLKIATLVNFAVVAVNLVAVRKITNLIKNREYSQAKKTIFEIRLMSVLFSGSLYLFGLYFGGYLLSLFGDEYINTGNVLNTLLLGQLIYSFCGVSVIVNNAFDNKKYNALVFIVGAVFNCSINLVLIPKFGILGAAYATLLTQLVVALPVYIKSYMEINSRC